VVGVAEEANDGRRRRKYVRRIILGLLAVVLILVVWTAIAALAARGSLNSARADLVTLRSSSAIDRQGVEQRLERDLSHVRSARGWLHQIGPRIVGAIPLAGRSIVAERTIADAATEAVSAGLAAAHDTDNLGAAGHIDLAQLTSTRADLLRHADRLRKPLLRLAGVNTSLTPGFVGHGVKQAQDALLGLDKDLVRGGDLALALHGVLGGGGPRKVLVALENNAELRATGGLISTFATGTASDGHLDLGHFRDVEGISASPSRAVKVAAPPAYTAHYGPYLANSTLWKNVNLDPDVPTTSQVLSEIAALTARFQPDVVVLLDVPAMADIIGATGPITLDTGRRLNKNELTKALLVDAYGGAANTLKAQNARRHRLEDAATRSLHRLTSARASLKLVRTLAHLAAGRHLTLWSARPTEEAALESAGVAGSVSALDRDLAMLTASNLGDSFIKSGRSGSGNKLDYYARRAVDVQVTIHKDVAHVVQTLTLHNNAPTGLRDYVAGPTHPGRLHELVAMTTASNAALESFTRDGAAQNVTIDKEHGYQRLSLVVDLERGHSVTWVLTYDVPMRDGIYRLDLVPQPLATPADLTLQVSRPDGSLDSLEGLDTNHGKIVYGGKWETVERVVVRPHKRKGWESFRHAISDFWTKPLGG
jgi:hypothetical protein